MEKDKTNYGPINFGGLKVFLFILMFAIPFAVSFAIGYSVIKTAIWVAMILILRYITKAGFLMANWGGLNYLNIMPQFVHAFRCCVRDDRKALGSYLGEYVDNNVVGHTIYHTLQNDGSIKKRNSFPLEAFAIQIPMGGWFRKPRLWIHREQSKIWKLKVGRWHRDWGYVQEVLYLVDKRGEKLPVSMERIFQILKHNHDNWTGHHDSQVTTIAVVDFVENELADCRKKITSLELRNELLSNVAFQTLDELMDGRSTFGKSPGGKAVRFSLGVKLLSLFPRDKRLVAYKPDAA